MQHTWCFVATDRATRQVVRRLDNLASASAENVEVACLYQNAQNLDLPKDSVCIALVREGEKASSCGIRIPYSTKRMTLINALQQAMDAPPTGREDIMIVMSNEVLDVTDKLRFQFIATVILDTLCVVFE
jgi:hypothetical protein